MASSRCSLEVRDFSRGSQQMLAPMWVTGISDSEGNFSIFIQNTKNGYKFTLAYKVTQKYHSAGILHDLVRYFGCGNVQIDNRKENAYKFNVTKLDSSLRLAGSLRFNRHFSSFNSPNNSSIVPVKVYAAETQKGEIFKENRGKSGIYRWVNLKNGNCYVGSGADLTKRLALYYSDTTLRTSLKKYKSAIYSSMLKYGPSGHRLEILEYCEKVKAVILSREQYYIDLLKPQYNLLQTAGSPLGYKHTEETLAKFRNRVHTEET